MSTSYELVGDDDATAGGPGGFKPLTEDERGKLEARGKVHGLTVDEVRHADRDGFDLSYYARLKGVRNNADFLRLREELALEAKAVEEARFQDAVAARRGAA